MDLTKTVPRSPKAKLAGVVMLARTTDKARAHNAGTPGPYHFGCGMDEHVLGFLGSDPDSFSKLVADLRDDARIEAWARERLRAKTPDDIVTFNADFAEDGPEPGTDSANFFRSEQQRLKRDDITSWFELLDLDEGREVPRRVAA